MWTSNCWTISSPCKFVLNILFLLLLLHMPVCCGWLCHSVNTQAEGSSVQRLSPAFLYVGSEDPIEGHRLVKQSLLPTEPNCQLFRGILPLPHSAVVSPYLPSYFGYWPYIVLTDCLLIFDMLLLSRDIVRGWTPTSCQRPKWWRKTVYFLLVYPCSHRFTLQGPQLMSRNLWSCTSSLGSHKTHFFKLSYTRL